jgi:hypothetical protein
VKTHIENYSLSSPFPPFTPIPPSRRFRPFFRVCERVGERRNVTMRTRPVVGEVKLLAVLNGQRVTLLDRTGKPVGGSLPVTRLEGPIDSATAECHLWRLAAARMAATCKRQMSLRRSDAWMRRADSLAHSFRIRGRDHRRPRTRQRFELYPTTTWPDAVHRMWQQGVSAARYHRLSGWRRWAYTVSNNHNKRKGGRYAATSDRYRENDSGHA